MKNEKTPLFCVEAQVDDYQAAMHLYCYARRLGYKVRVLDFTDEENEPKEVARFNGIRR